MKKIVAIVDYGLGNLFNIQSALSNVGFDSIVTDNEEQILGSSHLILPGVGSFKEGMTHLEDKKLINVLQDFKHSGRPLLGICLGMQLLMTKSYEGGEFQGLNFLKGNVVKLKKSDEVKIPHIGWNSLIKTTKNNVLFKDINNESYVYFLHSYCVAPERHEDIITQTHFGSDSFCSSINNGNVFGCQFHPELSANEGLKILKNFCNL